MDRFTRLALVLAIPAALLAQPKKDAASAHYGDCGAANGAGRNSTNYYGGGADPCAYTYSVPAEQMNRLLNELSYCSMYSRTEVNCSREIRGNYGQIRLNRQDGAGAGGGRNPGSAPNSAAGALPASAVTPAQRAQAEQMWQRSVALIDSNNYRAAIPLLLQAGRLGHAKAQATLGIAYQDGNGVNRDDRAAAYWFGLAAAQGHRAAQYALAGMYEEGEGGLTKDKAKARQLYLASADQGFDKAQLEAGMAYEVGDGVPRNRAKAIQLLRASGLGKGIADVLASPRTPARFNSFAELGAYIRRLAEIENQKLNTRVARSMGSGGQTSDNPVARINAQREFADWERAHGAARPYSK